MPILGSPNDKVSKTGDTMTGALLLPGDAVSNLQAAPKQQVVLKSGGAMTGPLFLVGDATTVLQAVPKQQLDAAISGVGSSSHPNLAAHDTLGLATQVELDAKLALNGGAMTGPLFLVGDAPTALQAVPKQQLDAVIAALPSNYPLAGALTGAEEYLGRQAGATVRVPGSSFDARFALKAAYIVIPTGTFNGLVDNTAAINAAHAANPNRTIGLPGPARITSGITFGDAGLCRADGTEATVYCDIPAGATAFTVNGTNECYWNVTLIAGAMNEATPRAIARNGIFFNLSGRSGRTDMVRALAFNGFGIKYESVWDSVLNDLVTIECGNATNFAFSVVDDLVIGASNHCTFNRIQVELSYDKAMLIDALTYNCTFLNIHSERTARVTSIGTDVTHDLRGVGCTYDTVRVEQAAGGAIPLVRIGSVWGAYRVLRAFVSNVEALITLQQPCTVECLQLSGTLTVPGTNVGRFTFRSCTLGAVTVNDQPAGRVTFEDCEHGGTVSETGNATDVTFDRCTFLSGFTVTASAGNPVCRATGTSFDQPPSTRGAKLSGCTVRNASAQFTSFACLYQLRGCLVVGNATVGSDGTRVRAWDTEFGGDLLYGAGTATGQTNGCLLTKVAPTIAAQWTVVNAMT